MLIILQTFLQTVGKNIREPLTICCVGFLIFNVLCNGFMNKQTSPLFCNNSKTLQPVRVTSI